MPRKSASRMSESTAAGREVTYQSLLAGLKGTPAYQLLFGVGLLGSSLGLGAMTIGWFQSDRQLEMFGFVAWVMLLAAVVAVIFFMERRGVDPVSKFSRRLKGYWWETITPNAPYLSSVEINSDQDTGIITLKAEAYGAASIEPMAQWRSEAVCLEPAKRRVFYIWAGENTSDSSEHRGGYGVMDFDSKLETASGHFVDLDKSLADRESIAWKNVRLERCTLEEIEIMGSRKRETKLQLISGRLDRRVAASSD